MRVLLAVIDELYTFAVSSIARLFISQEGESRILSLSDGRTSVENVDVLHRPSGSAVDEGSMLEEDVSQKNEDAETVQNPQPFKTVGDVLQESQPIGRPTEKNVVMYVGSTGLSLFKNPTKEFDGILTRIPYGAMVMLTNRKGRWAEVLYREARGWVLADDLVDRAAHVYPQFIIGEQNNADDPSTIRTRAVIDDVFSCGSAEMSLQAPEYVLYKLIRKGLTIAWPIGHTPRVPGAWHSILKGVPGVHISVTPKTGSIMEYMINENMGHLAYVEAVFPDETINISEVNYPDCGIYNERVLTHEEWKELKPIFIQVQ